MNVAVNMSDCPCGRTVRYVLNRDGEMVNSCNKYKRCPTYSELEKYNDEWRSRACKAEHELETLRKILAPKQTTPET